MVNSQFCPEPSQESYAQLLQQIDASSAEINEKLQKKQDVFATKTDIMQKLNLEIEENQQDYLAKLAELHKLQGELAAWRAEESRLCIEHHNKIFALAAEHKDQLNAEQRLVDEAKAFFDNKLALAKEATTKRDIAFATLNTIKEKNTASQAEQEKIAAELEAEIVDVSNKFSRIIQEAQIKYSLAQTEMDAAEKAVDIANKALLNATAPLADCEEDIKKLHTQLQQAEKDEAERLQALKQTQEQEMAAAKELEKQAEEVHLQSKISYEDALHIAQMAENAYLTTKQNALSLGAELRALFASSEQTVSDISAKMEKALAESTRVRSVYGNISSFYDEVELKLQKAQLHEDACRQKVLSSEIEEQDLHAAAVMAQNLADDATNSRKAAGPEMQEMLGQMEQSLLSSAKAAETAYQNKVAELLLDRASLQSAQEESAALTKTLAAAKKDVDEYEALGPITDKEILDLKEQSLERAKQREETEEQIKKTKDSYNAAASEILDLKKAMEEAISVCREAEMRAKQAAVAYEQASTAYNQLADEWDKKLEDNLAQSAEAYRELESLFSVTRDKRDKLFALQTQKKLDLTTAQRNYRSKASAHTAAEKNYLQVTAGAESTLAALKERIINMITTGKVIIAETEDHITEAANAYNEALVLSAEAEEAVAKAEKELSEKGDAFSAINAAALEKQEEANKAFEDLLNDNRLKISQLAQKTAQQELLVTEADTRKNEDAEKANSLNSELEALLLNISTMTEEQKELNQKRKLVEEEQAEYQKELDAAAELQRKEEEERQKALEAKRLQKEKEEQERLQKEREIAEARAEEERQKIRAAKEAAEKQEEEKAVRMAKGEFLTNEDDLADIDDETLNKRLQRMQQLVKEEWQKSAPKKVTDERKAELQEDIERFSTAAKDNKILFATAQRTYNNLLKQVAEQEDKKKELNESKSKYIQQIEKNQRNQAKRETALQDLEQSLLDAAADEAKTTEPLVVGLRQAIEDNIKNIKLAEEALDKTEKDITAADKKIEDIKAKLEEAEGALNNAFGKWFYNENMSYKNKLMADILESGNKKQQEPIDTAVSDVDATKDNAAANKDKPANKKSNKKTK